MSLALDVPNFGQLYDPKDPESGYIPKDIGKIKGLRDKNALFDIHSKWGENEMYCIDIQTPPPFTTLVPYYNVYIRWSKSTECNPNVPLTNFQITLHNDPKTAGTKVSPKVKSLWSKQIAVNVPKMEFLWQVPLIAEDNIKNMSLFYIKVETEGIINSGVYTVFGVTGPFTIWKSPDTVNKTLYGPPPKDNNAGNETMKQKLGKTVSLGNTNALKYMSFEDTLFNIAALLSIIMAAVALF
ncbi:16444_t:CDS:2, partial [Racocetra fulgida]